MGFQLTISSADYGPVRVFKLSGYLAQLEVYRFKRAVEHALHDGKRAIIANLEQVEFVDSAGIASLIHMRKEGNRAGIATVLVLKRNSGVCKVLTATNLGDFMQISFKMDEALKSCGADAPRADSAEDAVTITNMINSCDTILEGQPYRGEY